MVSPVDVANISLDNIGARFSISSLTPPAPPPNAAVVARQYGLRIDALHRAAHWNCTRRQGALTLIGAAQGTPENPNGTTLPIPPVPWQYEYALPADCLKARFLIPNPPTTGATNPPILAGGVVQTPIWFPPIGYEFEVGVDYDQSTPPQQIRVILTNLEFAQLVYTGRITNPDLWDPHFLNAACATLGAWLVNPLARSAQVLKEQIEIASSIITQARISDGNEGGPTSVDHEPDWMRVRGFSGYQIAGEQGGRCWYGWDAMGFPGGGYV
jgi:hypothetical protein